MLANVAKALRAAFVARECPAKVYVGEQYSHDHADGLRVVLVPTDDSFGPRDASVAGYPEFVPTLTRLNPRALGTRAIGFRAELWAPAPDLLNADDPVANDYAMADALINCTVASLHEIALGCVDFTGGSYVNEKAVHARRGIAYHLTAVVACPVIDVKFPPARQTTYDAERMTAEVDVIGQLPEDVTLVSFEVDPAAE